MKNFCSAHIDNNGIHTKLETVTNNNNTSATNSNTSDSNNNDCVTEYQVTEILETFRQKMADHVSASFDTIAGRCT